ncbi:hypothetical protein QQF64_018040 [Cirrhinus molitorella]|uniref:Uncharacterized protein n=1 Tax=Cirrhinus molitorella TaxID=172907 RepID=A0ABR3LNY8_9TELE
MQIRSGASLRPARWCSRLAPLSPVSRFSRLRSLLSNGMTEKQNSVSRSRLWASRASRFLPCFSLPPCDSRPR